MNHTVTVWKAALVIIAATAFTQLSAQSPAPKPTFEVASIRPVDPSVAGFHIQTAPGGRYMATGVTAKFLIMQEQLGLKLESEKGPVEMFLIEGVERPSAN